jgi:hypothetical protein
VAVGVKVAVPATVFVDVLVGVEAVTTVDGVTDKLRVQLTATPRRMVIVKMLMNCHCLINFTACLRLI